MLPPFSHLEIRMLSEEETQRINAYSVWKEQQRYSDQELWSWLLKQNEREIKVLRQIPLAYTLAFSDVADYDFWRDYWLKLVLELQASQLLTKAIIWHLEQRGDPSIVEWLVQCERSKRDIALECQKAAWGVEQ